MAFESLRRLPFDLYGRYRLASEIAEQIGAQRLLDVGGGPGVLDAFCPDAVTVAVDLRVPRTHEWPARLVVADGRLLPLTDGSVDLVVLLDTLEHVNQSERRLLLAEALRVSRGWVLVAGPCDTPGVSDADAALLAFLRAKFGEDFETVGMLTEHLVLGHPEPVELEMALRSTGADTRRFPSGRLDRWLPMMMLFHELLALGRDDPVERVQSWYNERFYRDDLRDPAYRQAFLARLPDAAGPSLDEVVDSLLPSSEEPVRDAAGFEALRTLLEGSFVEAGEAHARELADAQERLAEVERANAELTERAEAAEAHVELLLAFRDRVLNHPAVKIRRGLRRPFRP